ncbi:oligosaccharide flippase family protein [Pedobacter petrophilus]|uniref:Oligosaccharide flippase family protein n=1 Tax=Pedobacter petrophilus TaxID=1908241 RepID=A0A7K0FZU3_9SPHI|nr:flippase [Pedobacter petrophilus]MRX76700.1 oligosaccharide flippase family protein [Pedobacter petrophilus]
MSGLKKNIAFNTLLSISQILFPLVTFPYASRILGPAGMGAVNFADNFITYFLIFSALGIPLYGVREIAKVKNDTIALGRVFSALIFIHLITSVISIVILLVISLSTEKLSANFQLYQIGMAILLGNVFIAEWFFQGVEKFKYIAIRTVSIRLFTILLLFALVHSIADRNTYYALNLVATLLAAATNMYSVSKMVKISFKNLELKHHLKPLFIIFSNSIITTIYLVFDTIILGFLTGDVQVGYYAAAMRISKISLAVIGVLSAVLLPRLTIAFKEKNWSEAKLLLNKSINFVVFLSIPIAIGTYCLSEEIIRLFAGQQYLPAVSALQILCFIVVFVGMAQVFAHQILLPLHQERKILYASLFGVVVSLGLNFLLIPVYKQNGAAISSLATEFSVTLLLFYFSLKLFKVKFPFLETLQALLTSALFFLIKMLVLKISTLPVVVVMITVPLSGLVYLSMQVFVWKNKNVVEILSGFGPLKFLQKI